MQRFRVLPESELSEQHFDEWPVWSEHYDFEEIEDIVRWGLNRDEVLRAFQQNERDGEHCVYTLLESNPFPPRMRIFIRATLEAANGMHLKGFVMNEGDLCLAVFSKGETFTFSSHPMLHDLERKQEQRLRESLGNPEGSIFPMKFQTEFRGENGQIIAGVFQRGGSET